MTGIPDRFVGAFAVVRQLAKALLLHFIFGFAQTFARVGTEPSG